MVSAASLLPLTSPGHLSQLQMAKVAWRLTVGRAYAASFDRLCKSRGPQGLYDDLRNPVKIAEQLVVLDRGLVHAGGSIQLVRPTHSCSAAAVAARWGTNNILTCATTSSSSQCRCPRRSSRCHHHSNRCHHSSRSWGRASLLS